MKLRDFDVNESLSELDSDEGSDPVMMIATMPDWWRDALIAVFAARN